MRRRGNLAARQTWVLYDGRCPICTRSTRLLRRLDSRGVLNLVSFRESGVAEGFGLDFDRLAQRLHCITPEGQALEGVDALLHLARRLPPLWPLLPLLAAAQALGFGQPLYDLVASRRSILPLEGCDEACALEHQRPPDTT